VSDQNEVVVLKFGSSILSGEGRLGDAVREVYREVRAGRRVVAVVSAIGHTTDRLVNRAGVISADPDPGAFAALLATGEARASAEVALALDAAGIPTTLLTSHELAIRTTGLRLDAQPVSLDTARVKAALERSSVVVVPGFVGVGDDGATTLLGRGGSDYTALFIAEQISADRVRLLKDVDGWFEGDPEEPGPDGAPVARYERLSWADAAQSDAPVVQHKAVLFAAEHELSFEVGALGSVAPTVVGGHQSRLAQQAAPRRALRVALLGLGVVGLGVYRELARDRRFEVSSILVKNVRKPRDRDVPIDLLTDDAEAVLAARPDVVIELLGGLDPAAGIITAALSRGIDVVTANKAVIARDGGELHGLAWRRGVELRYSASVGGALPALEVVRRIASQSPIRSIRGVLNGTTNFILDRLGSGRSFREALAEAQANGFAEADPSNDLNGRDAGAKLTLLVRAAFDEEFASSEIACTGIELAASPPYQPPTDGRRDRLVAEAVLTDDGVRARVSMQRLAGDDPLAAVHAERNAIVITTADGRSVVLRGRGAGRAPTTASVYADLGDVWQAAGRVRAATGTRAEVALS